VKYVYFFSEDVALDCRVNHIDFAVFSCALYSRVFFISFVSVSFVLSMLFLFCSFVQVYKSSATKRFLIFSYGFSCWILSSLTMNWWFSCWEDQGRIDLSKYLLYGLFIQFGLINLKGSSSWICMKSCKNVIVVQFLKYEKHLITFWLYLKSSLNSKVS